jgi:hypothetical protein
MVSDDDLTLNELLDLLQEEAAEVILAASKCKRFGFDKTHEVYGHNATELALECGQLTGVMDELRLRAMDAFERGRSEKMPKAREAKRLYGI